MAAIIITIIIAIPAYNIWCEYQGWKDEEEDKRMHYKVYGKRKPRK